MTDVQKLPPAADILEMMRRGESQTAIGARYGVGKDAVSQAVGRARKRGEIPPLPPQPKPAPVQPTRRSMSTARAVNDLTITPRSNGASTGDRALPGAAPEGQQCGARQLLGSRICDGWPHDPKTRHVGPDSTGKRAEFWGQR